MRVHSHADPANWRDLRQFGRERPFIKTVCRICGRFIGYRPASDTRQRQRRAPTHRQQTIDPP